MDLVERLFSSVSSEDVLERADPSDMKAKIVPAWSLEMVEGWKCRDY